MAFLLLWTGLLAFNYCAFFREALTLLYYSDIHKKLFCFFLRILPAYCFILPVLF